MASKLKLSFLANGFEQVAILVPNLEEAVQHYWELTGIGPWTIYTYGKPLLKAATYRSQEADPVQRIALASLGPLRIELIEPVRGPSIFYDWIAKHGYGLHHVGIRVENMEAALAEARAAGLAVIQEGMGYGLDGDGHYAYLDTEQALGMILELSEFPKRRVSPERVFPVWEETEQHTGRNEAMNETLQTMWQRRSIRKYKPDPLPEEHLKLILEAARRAPTGANRQNWRMVVVQDAEMRRKVAEACNGQTWMADAPLILCMVTLPGEGQVNGTIVLDHAILAATSLGYGTCWVGACDRDKLKELLGIPADHGITNLTPVGLPAESPEARKRKPPAELFRRDRFDTPLDYAI